MQCDRCAGESCTKAGRDRQGRQLYRCTGCGRHMTTRSRSVFRGYCFPDMVITLAVRHSLRFRLSYADVVELLAERGVELDARTVYDWVRAFTPHFIAAARAHRSPVGRRWSVDETYVKLGKRWYYLFRALDEHGQIVDVYLSTRRNTAAAEAFFETALDTSPVSPTRVTTGHPLGEAKCYPPALQTLLPNTEHRTSKYLNNSLERDHQHLNGRVRPMRWFKSVDGASNFCHGYTLIRNLVCGFSLLTAKVPARLRLATAWSALAATL